MIDKRPIHLVLLAMLSLPWLAGCSEVDTDRHETATRDDGTLTLAAVLGTDEELGTLQDALTQSELYGVVEGPASYTLLAPVDTAFEALGTEGAVLLEEEQRPVLVGILRDHLLPGHITPESIRQAIEERGGPVAMTTLGEAEAKFSLVGDTVSVGLGEKPTARFTGSAIAANNGVVIPIDAVLLPPEG